MTDAREIIAQGFRRAHGNTCYPDASDVECKIAATAIVASLHAAGYRILGPDEVDPVTLEKAAQLIEVNCLMNTSSGQELSPRMEGDMNGLAYAAAIRALGRKA